MAWLEQQIGVCHAICLEAAGLKMIRHGQVKISACFSIDDQLYYAYMFLERDGWLFDNWKVVEFACSDAVPCGGRDIFDAMGLRQEFSAIVHLPSSSWFASVPRAGSCLLIRTKSISKRWVLRAGLESVIPSLRDFATKFHVKMATSGLCAPSYCLFRAFSPVVVVDPHWLAWNSGTIPALAQSIHDECLPAGLGLDVKRLAVLADALEEAGCTDTAVLDHLRSPSPHARRCRVIDALIAHEYGKK